MLNSTISQRIESLEKGFCQIGDILLRFGNNAVARHISPAESLSNSHNIGEFGAVSVAQGDAISLPQFLAGVPPLLPTQQLQIVKAAIKMLEGVYVPLPLKRAMHGIDPLQRLRLVNLRLQESIEHN